MRCQRKIKMKNYTVGTQINYDRMRFRPSFYIFVFLFCFSTSNHTSCDHNIIINDLGHTGDPLNSIKINIGVLKTQLGNTFLLINSRRVKAKYETRRICIRDKRRTKLCKLHEKSYVYIILHMLVRT